MVPTLVKYSSVNFVNVDGRVKVKRRECCAIQAINILNVLVLKEEGRDDYYPTGNILVSIISTHFNQATTLAR